MNKKDHVQSIEKGFNLLDCLSAEAVPLSLENLTRKSGYSKTACFRFLKTLVGLGLVEQDPKWKTYQLGPRLASLGLSALKRLSLRQEALPVMQKLRDETQETVNLAILSGVEVLFLERIMSDYLVNSNINIGDRLPVYCASLGKVILAFLSENRCNEIISKLEFRARTDRTLITASSFNKELIEIRIKGFAINNEELEKGLQAVAAPILNYTGEAIAAINVAWASARYQSRRTFANFAEKVIAAADTISSRMGYQK